MHAKDTLGLIVSGKPDFLAVKDLKTNSLSDWEFGTLSLPDTKLMYHSSQHGANYIF